MFKNKDIEYKKVKLFDILVEFMLTIRQSIYINLS